MIAQVLNLTITVIHYKGQKLKIKNRVTLIVLNLTQIGKIVNLQKVLIKREKENEFGFTKSNLTLDGGMPLAINMMLSEAN
jgi:hypothetical protein